MNGLNKTGIGNTALFLGAAAMSAAGFASCTKAKADQRPNIILIMADDMGYSDIGCFGSEIPTPNIDRLAASGVRYTQFYNTGRSCPTRASLLTGLYPHQAGIGEMSEDPFDTSKRDSSVFNRGLPGYMGYLNRNSVTIAEVMKSAGYHTYMTGKWHVGMQGMEKWPLQRGFDRFYGILSGACSYLQPGGDRGLTLDNQELPSPEGPYYTTDAFTDYAIDFMDSDRGGSPFFLYLAYNAPHWPLQARQEDIAKFFGKYDIGWEAVRQARYARMKDMGIINPDWELAEWESRKWEELTPQEQANSSMRMSVYAAQVHRMDYNIGRILDYLTANSMLENTLIVFFSDNGACAEPYSETGFGTVGDINDPAKWVDPSYGLPWAQVSNTPLRKYKVRAYEGGISTPMILSWPVKYAGYNSQIRSNAGFLPDIMATFIDAAGTSYPGVYNGHHITPAVGTSLLPTVADPGAVLHDYMFGEHYENRYVRHGKWKAVRDQTSSQWELYDIEKDRSETRNLAGEQAALLSGMAEKWEQWAATHNVYPK